MGLASLQLTVHTVLGSPEAPSTAAVEAAEVWARDEYAELGHGDFAYSARELAATCASDERHRWVTVLAHEGDGCVGVACAQVPQVDNRHLLAVDLRLDPAVEANVVLDALWSVVSDLLVAEARDTVVVWVLSALPTEAGSSGEALSPKTGVGSVRRTVTTDWLVSHGFELEQVEVASTLAVVEALARGEVLEAETATASPGYDLVSWAGVTPPELQDAMAEQRVWMSTDVPLGEIAMQPEVWDAARVQDEDRVLIDMGRSLFWTVAIERTSGAVVAYTLLTCSDEGRPDVAMQGDTLVRAEHRGHRLGMRIKAANLRQLAGQRPRVQKIHTWNADENDWMLAINRDLGFRPTSVLGCWQLRVAGTVEPEQ